MSTHRYALPYSSVAMSQPSKIVWQNQVNIPLQIQKPTIPDGTIHDRTANGRFRQEYNPYFFDEYKNRNIY
jgi:hypothetical protein